MKLLVFMCVDKTLTTERTTVDILCMYVIYVLCVDIVIVCRLWMVLCYVSKLILINFVTQIPNDTIIQRWRMKSWPDAHYSVVTIKLSQSSNSTTLTLSQTGIPSEESERTKEGWRNYYWNSIRQTFGFAVDINF